jgi:hypothetical protein
MSAASAEDVDSGKVATVAAIATAQASQRRADRTVEIVMSVTFRKTV